VDVFIVCHAQGLAEKCCVELSFVPAVTLDLKITVSLAFAWTVWEN